MKRKDQPELQALCRFCEHAHTLREEETLLCEKKGIVRADHRCRAFRYDPLKREPAPVPSVPALEYVPLPDKN